MPALPHLVILLSFCINICASSHSGKELNHVELNKGPHQIVNYGPGTELLEELIHSPLPIPNAYRRSAAGNANVVPDVPVKRPIKFQNKTEYKPIRIKVVYIKQSNAADRVNDEKQRYLEKIVSEAVSTLQAALLVI